MIFIRHFLIKSQKTNVFMFIQICGLTPIITEKSLMIVRVKKLQIPIQKNKNIK